MVNMEESDVQQSVDILTICFKDINPLIKAHWQLRPHLKDSHAEQETYFWNKAIGESFKSKLNIVVKHSSDMNKVVGVSATLDYSNS